jgi:hypothetical protein
MLLIIAIYHAHGRTRVLRAATRPALPPIPLAAGADVKLQPNSRSLGEVLADGAEPLSRDGTRQAVGSWHTRGTLLSIWPPHVSPGHRVPAGTNRPEKRRRGL